MAQVKKFIKSDIVTAIEQVVKFHYKTFIISRNNKIIVIEYSKLKNMTLNSIVTMINNKELWFAIVTMEDKPYVPRKKNAPKEPSNIGGCKAKLKDIYGTD
jgi:hypothetical protein